MGEKLRLKKKIVTRGKKKSKPYFGIDVHDAIVEYQNTPCEEERHEIYDTQIRKAFEKLSENLIAELQVYINV